MVEIGLRLKKYIGSLVQYLRRYSYKPDEFAALPQRSDFDVRGHKANRVPNANLLNINMLYINFNR